MTKKAVEEQQTLKHERYESRCAVKKRRYLWCTNETLPAPRGARLVQKCVVARERVNDQARLILPSGPFTRTDGLPLGTKREQFEIGQERQSHGN